MNRTMSESTSGLAELLLIDQHERWRKGERVQVEDYLQKHPGLAGQEEAVLDLIYNEIFLREGRGEAPRLDEYLARFPQLADPLRMQFEIHRAMKPEDFFRVAGGPEPDEPAAPAPRPTATNRPAIPGYEILGELGRGATSIVYRARQVSLKRVVALKVILSGPRIGAQHLARFRAEAEAVAQLQHPNIVQIFEVGEHQGRPYFSLELVEGGSLAQAVGSGQWAVGSREGARRGAQLLATVARAVHYAHQHGIVHRDLKPANILLAPAAADHFQPTAHCPLPTDPPTVPKITDFGLAKRLDGGSRLTRLGDVLGTPSYMATEQAWGRSQQAGPPADIYALGAILYELLTGRPPHAGTTPMEAVIEAGTSAPAGRGAPRPRSHLPQVSAEESAAALSLGRGAGGRVGPLPGGRAGRGSAGRSLGAGDQVDAAPAHRGGPARGQQPRRARPAPGQLDGHGSAAPGARPRG